jgi:transposase
VSVTIPTHQRLKHGRKRLDASLPRVDVIHDISEAEKRCTADGTTLERIGEEISEQLDYQPAKIRVIRNIRPKYACPCCRQGIKIAPVPAMLFPKSIATPALLAQITTAKFVDHVPLYRQETQFCRLRVCLGRATMAGWMIRLGATHVVPIINLLIDRLLETPLIHCDETRLQVLNSGKAPAADHWMWVRAAGPPGRRIILFDYDPSRGGAVPRRLLEGYRGILLTDGYEAYAKVALALGLVHASCMTTRAERSMRLINRSRQTRQVTPRSPSILSVSCTGSGDRYGIATTRSPPSNECGHAPNDPHPSSIVSIDGSRALRRRSCHRAGWAGRSTTRSDNGLSSPYFSNTARCLSITTAARTRSVPL